MLWNRSLVMSDPETGTLWSHLLGKAMAGKLKGQRLEQIPCVMTDWKSWKQQHPDGTVMMLSRTSKSFTRDFYKNPERFVLGIATDGKAKSWSFEQMIVDPARHDDYDGQAVLVAFDVKSFTPALYRRTFNGRLLSFEIKEGKLVDSETGSTWNPISGRAVAGKLKGGHLTALPAIVSFAKAWKTFHPESVSGGVR